MVKDVLFWGGRLKYKQYSKNNSRNTLESLYAKIKEHPEHIFCTEDENYHNTARLQKKI